MNPLMLRVSSSVMATAAFMLMGVAIVLATPGVSHAIVQPLTCPSERVNGKCDADCTKRNQECTPITYDPGDGSMQPGCLCLIP